MPVGGECEAAVEEAAECEEVGGPELCEAAGHELGGMRIPQHDAVPDEERHLRRTIVLMITMIVMIFMFIMGVSIMQSHWLFTPYMMKAPTKSHRKRYSMTASMTMPRARWSISRFRMTETRALTEGRSVLPSFSTNSLSVG